MSDPITPSCLPPDSSIGDSDKIIVALYRVSGEIRFPTPRESLMPIEYLAFDNYDQGHALKRANIAAMNMLEATKDSGRFEIQIGEGHCSGSWPVIERLIDSITFRAGGVGR